MKKLLAILISAVMLMIATGCSGNTGLSDISDSSSEEKVANIEGGFSVNGTKLLDAYGNEFVMRGLNHPHCWFRSKDEIALPAIADTGCNTVRIVCRAGVISRDSVDTAYTLRKVIEQCAKLKMICVLEAHDVTGKDDITQLEQVTDWWISVKDALIGKEEYVILNIANEWTGKWDSKLWRDGYTAAIPRLREAGIKNTIMVDAGGWGQYGKSIKDYGVEVLNSDPDKNTMFSVHMYGSAGKNEQSIESNIKGATDQELCIIVGEFGHNHSDGDVNELYIMEYCEKNDIGYLGWSWKGNSGGVEYLDIATEWDGSVLSPDWGEILINGENGIRKTSEICSVFK